MASRSSRVARLVAALLLPAASPAAVPAAGVVAGLLAGRSSAAWARGAPDSFADLAARLLPAVVNISSTETVSTDQGDGDDNDDPGSPGGPGGGQGGGPGGGPGGPGPALPFPPGSPFEKFFHDFMNRHNQADPNAPPRKMQALGSGFIIDPSGIIVTNNHVINGADEITVTLQDNTVLKAKLLGHDERTDLAVLQVKTDRKLSAVTFGDSDKSRVGDWVVAIGNPFGLSGTVTAGIISSRGRDIQQGPYDDFIQTDAPINKGNSGGPLFNTDGEVVGINTAIYSPSGGSIGIGFSIPANEARLVIAQLRQFGHARRGWIGVRIQDVTPDIADSLGLKGSRRGALIAGLEATGPARQAGLQSGDVILQLDGKDVDGRSLPRLVAETPVGERAQMQVWRDSKRQTIPVVIGNFPEEPKPQTHPQPPRPSSAAPVGVPGLGMRVAAITDALRQKYQLPDGQKGVVVIDLDQNGRAAERGLRPGDVITEVQQTDVTSPGELLDRIGEARRAKHASVLMLVQNGDGMRWVPLPIDAPSAVHRGNLDRPSGD